MACKRALARARALVGTKFRPQGRDPDSGLDCIGLVIQAFGLAKERLPDDYRLSAPSRQPELRAAIDRYFREVGQSQPGNLLLMAIGARQHHLAVQAEDGVIHADARRGRVIEGPLPTGATVIAAYRKRRTPLIGDKD